MMFVDGRTLDNEQCEQTKEVVSKFGVTVVCSEDEAKASADFVLPAGEDCENIKEVVSKIGKTVVCDEEA